MTSRAVQQVFVTQATFWSVTRVCRYPWFQSLTGPWATTTIIIYNSPLLSNVYLFHCSNCNKKANSLWLILAPSIIISDRLWAQGLKTILFAITRPDELCECDTHHKNATCALFQTFGASAHFIPKNLKGKLESTKHYDIQSKYMAGTIYSPLLLTSLPTPKPVSNHGTIIRLILIF